MFLRQKHVVNSLMKLAPGHRETFLMRLGITARVQGGLFTLAPLRKLRKSEKYFTCPSWESNPGRWIYRQTLYHVAVKAGFYRKAV